MRAHHVASSVYVLEAWPEAPAGTGKQGQAVEEWSVYCWGRGGFVCHCLWLMSVIGVLQFILSVSLQPLDCDLSFILKLSLPGTRVPAATVFRRPKCVCNSRLLVEVNEGRQRGRSLRGCARALPRGLDVAEAPVHWGCVCQSS